METVAKDALSAYRLQERRPQASLKFEMVISIFVEKMAEELVRQ